MGPGVGPRAGLGGLSTRRHAQYPAFALGSSEMAIGFFGLLYLIIPNLSQLHIHTVIFSPL